jgi:hypothetical protein
MSAATLYEALLSTIEEQTLLNDPLSPIEIIGALEMCKHDMLTAFDDDGDDDDSDAMEDDGEDCGCDAELCAA